MKLFIPKLATRFTVNKPWTFTLHDEFRNVEWWTRMTGNGPQRPTKFTPYSQWTPGSVDPNSAKPISVTIPKGTILSIDRIYIRKGVSDFDSVTFKVIKGSPIPHGRFWAKLADVNNGLDVTPI